jgi:MFS family permease
VSEAGTELTDEGAPGHSGRIPARVGRFEVPPFIRDLDGEPGALAALAAGALALFVAGLDPKVFSPGMPTMQSALRERPALENLFLLAVVVQAAFYLVGGAAGDIIGYRKVLLVGLAGMIAFEALPIIGDEGPIFLVARIGASASIGLVIPTAIAMVAMAYTGATRATGLGAAYAMLGLSSALAPALLSAVTPTFGRWLAFVVVALVAIPAFALVRRRTTALLGARPRAEFVAGHGLWAFGLLCLTAALVGLDGGAFGTMRMALLGLGGAVMVVFLVWQRRVRDRMDPTLAIDIRPVTIALFAGVVVAFAQAAPSLEAPVFFRIVQGWGPLAATAAIAPLVLALLVAGPVAGIMLVRYRPRTLVAGGMLVLGLGDMAFALVAPATPYLYFIVPFMAVGAGFVIATTVRTAIIFASVPRRLPSTAAALNQTSLLVGSQLGVAVVTTLITVFATNEMHDQVASLPAPQQADLLAQFTTFFQALGTATFGAIVDTLDAATVAQFGAAYAAGLASAVAIMGTVTVIAAVVSWLGMGRSEAVVSVWEHRDERPGAVSPDAGMSAT